MNKMNQYQRTNLFFCFFCNKHKNENNSTKLLQPVDLNTYHESLSNAQKLLLHWHHRICHLNMISIQDMAKKGILPKEIANLNLLCGPIFNFQNHTGNIQTRTIQS